MKFLNPEHINAYEISKQVETESKVEFEFSHQYNWGMVLEQINELAARHKRAIEVKFNGFQDEIFDVSVIKAIPEVRCLTLGCILKASHLNEISTLKNLKEFSLGIYELNEPDILAQIPKVGLRALTLADTVKSNIDLKHLREFYGLTFFHSSGQSTHLNYISELKNLETLSFSMIKTSECMAFISELPKLEELRLLRGGRASLADIRSSSLKRINISKVRGLHALGNIGRFSQLEELVFEDQPRVEEIDFRNSAELKEVTITNCKRLQKLKGLDMLPKLSRLCIFKTALDFEEVLASVPKSLSSFEFYTGKVTTDDKIRNRLKDLGYVE